MNKFNFDHPMYVHNLAQPEKFSAADAETIARSYKSSNALATASAFDVLNNNPYPHFGWSISQETVDKILEFNGNVDSIIEVGTFIGRGVLAFSSYLGRLDTPIITVDTYFGTLLIEAENRSDVLPFFNQHAVAALFVNRGLGSVTFPVRSSSRDFFRGFYYRGLQSSHIYLDASHEYLDTYEELSLAWECLSEGGVLAGDDYNWATVKAAVDRFCFERRLAYVVTKGANSDGIQALQWVIAPKDSTKRHDDMYHVVQIVNAAAG